MCTLSMSCPRMKSQLGNTRFLGKSFKDETVPIFSKSLLTGNEMLASKSQVHVINFKFQ